MNKEEVAELALRIAVRYNAAADACQALAARYDDAMKRISDLTAELEYLRREVNRG